MKAERADGPERKCIVTGDVQPKSGLIRFVIGPDGQVVPDILGKLPGRGLYVTSDREVIEKAKRGQFARAARWAERSVLLEVDDMRGGVTQRDQWSTARSWAERNEALDDTLSRWMRCCKRLDDAAQAQRILDLAAEWGLNDELVEHLEDLGP